MNGNGLPQNANAEQAVIYAAAQDAVNRLNKGFDFTSGAALYPSSLGLEQMGGAAFDFSTGAARYPSGMGLGTPAGDDADKDKGNKWVWIAVALGAGYLVWKQYGKKGRRK